MQNWFSSVVLRRSIYCLLIFAGSLVANGSALGQFQANRQFRGEHVRGGQRSAGHDFGDTPSPAQMLALLKFQKETPWFDLLRESGTDIFSKLSESDRQIAEQFAENLIESQGLDSEQIKMLMEKMNVNPKLQTELQNIFDDQDSNPPNIDQLGQRLEKIQKELSKSGGGFDPAKNPFPQEREPLTPRSAKKRDQFSGSGRGETTRPQSPSNRSENSGAEPNKPAPINKPELSELGKSPEKIHSQRDADPNGNSGRSSKRIEEPRLDDSDSGTPSLAMSGQQTQNEGVLNQESMPDNRTALQKRIDEALEGSQNPEEKKPSDAGSRGDFKGPDNVVRPGDSSGPRYDEPGTAGGTESKGLPSRDGVFKPNGTKPSQQGDGLSGRGDAIKYPDATQPAASQPNGAERSNNSAPSGGSYLGQPKAGRHLPPNRAANDQWIQGFVHSAKQAMKADLDQRGSLGGKKLKPSEVKKLKELFEESDQWLKNERLRKRKFANKSRKPAERLDQMLIQGVQEALEEENEESVDGSKSIFSKLLDGALDTALNQAEADAQRKVDEKSRELNSRQPFSSDEDWSRMDPAGTMGGSGNQDFGSLSNSPRKPAAQRQQSAAASPKSESVIEQAADVVKSLAEVKFNGWYLVYAAVTAAFLIGAVMLMLKLSAPPDERLARQKELQRKLDNGSMRDPKNVVDAVDLFLLSRFGGGASWWNSKHATEELNRSQAGIKDQVDDVFRVYKSSRYQQTLKQTVSEADQSTVRSTLTELAKIPLEDFAPTEKDTAAGLETEVESAVGNDEAVS